MHTPLLFSLSFRQGHLSMVVQLMKYGADPSLIDGEGCSCVHLATQFGHTSIVAYLIAKGQVHLFNAYKTLCGALISSKQKLEKSQPIRIFWLRFWANEISLWVELLRKTPYHSILFINMLKSWLIMHFVVLSPFSACRGCLWHFHPWKFDL